MKNGLTISSILLFYTVCCSAHVSAQTIDSTAVRLRYRPGNYYELGVATAELDYSGGEQFTIGLLTGIALPITTALSASIKTPVPAVTGLAGFGLALWSGRKIANSFKKPTPDKYLADIGGTDQRFFRDGYETTVDEKRRAGFVSGAILGVAIDIGITWYIISQFVKTMSSFS